MIEEAVVDLNKKFNKKTLTSEIKKIIKEDLKDECHDFEIIDLKDSPLRVTSNGKLKGSCFIGLEGDSIVHANSYHSSRGDVGHVYASAITEGLAVRYNGLIPNFDQPDIDVAGWRFNPKKNKFIEITHEQKNDF